MKGELPAGTHCKYSVILDARSVIWNRGSGGESFSGFRWNDDLEGNGLQGTHCKYAVIPDARSASRNPGNGGSTIWIPAFAGMTVEPSSNPCYRNFVL
jgi:hypothetical protein